MHFSSIATVDWPPAPNCRDFTLYGRVPEQYFRAIFRDPERDGGGYQRNVGPCWRRPIRVVGVKVFRHRPETVPAVVRHQPSDNVVDCCVTNLRPAWKAVHPRAIHIEKPTDLL